MKTAAAEPEKQKGRGLVALVIDDNRLTRALVREELEKRGFRVVEAEDTDDALEIYQHQGPAAVIIDFDRVDGRAPEIAEALICAAPEATVVAITSTVLPAFRERLLTMGVKEIVEKPYDRPELVAAATEGAVQT